MLHYYGYIPILQAYLCRYVCATSKLHARGRTCRATSKLCASAECCVYTSLPHSYLSQWSLKAIYSYHKLYNTASSEEFEPLGFCKGQFEFTTELCGRKVHSYSAAFLFVVVTVVTSVYAILLITVCWTPNTTSEL